MLVRSLYEQGASDRKIAARAGVSATTIANWRKRNGLPANHARGKKPAEPSYAGVVLDQNIAGVSDRRIARALNIERQQIRNERIRQSLPPCVSRPDESKLHALYGEGLWDSEIARRAGVSYTFVADWRKRNGLAPHPYRGENTCSGIELYSDEVRALYELGLSDRKIGLAVGTSQTTIRMWRLARNLPANNAKTPDWDEVRRLYDAGETDRSIAHQLGISESSVQSWRRKNGIGPAVRKNRIDSERALELYKEGKPDPEIAEVFGVTPGAVRFWRKKMGLALKSKTNKSG